MTETIHSMLKNMMESGEVNTRIVLTNVDRFIRMTVIEVGEDTFRTKNKFTSFTVPISSVLYIADKNLD